MMAYWLRSSILLCVGAVYSVWSRGFRFVRGAKLRLCQPRLGASFDPGMTESDVL